MERSRPWAVLETVSVAPRDGPSVVAGTAAVSLPGFGFPSKVRLTTFLKTTAHSVRSMAFGWKRVAKSGGLTFVASSTLLLLIQLNLRQRLHHVPGLHEHLLAVPELLQLHHVGILGLAWI